MGKLLDKIDSPQDLRRLSLDELPALCEELRAFIVENVAKTGGHLASSVGAVEIAVALHYVYATPEDKIVWDTGHQAYAHKILTGRKNLFHTLRQKDGLGGFPAPEESPYDCFPAGHASTSISVALGLAAARDLKKETHQIVAVIGDGAMTSGLALEGLNNNNARKNFTIILNDNAMSISPTKGAIAKHFARLISNPKYRQFKHTCGKILGKIPWLGEHLTNFTMRVLGAFKLIFVVDNIFEKLGFHYIGPVNGNDVKELVRILRARSEEQDMPVVLHCHTKKGLGYSFAENNPERFHGIGPFDLQTGEEIKAKKSAPSYTEIVSDTVMSIAEHDKRVVVVSAAMCGGTGMTRFAGRFPGRFFDVGIAESHAVTFAGALASSGYRPVVGIYSTFLQRAYDQICHDVCLPDVPVILALDRAGLVGADGKTHHGAFDLAYLRHLPNIKIFAPRDRAAVEAVFAWALSQNSPVAIRYPRGTIPLDLPSNELLPFSSDALHWQSVREGSELCFLAIGQLVFMAARAAEILETQYGIKAKVVDACAIKPSDDETLKDISPLPIITLEDGVLAGGFGSMIAERLSDLGLQTKLLRRGIPDRFISHGTQKELYAELGWLPEQLATDAVAFLKK